MGYAFEVSVFQCIESSFYANMAILVQCGVLTLTPFLPLTLVQIIYPKSFAKSLNNEVTRLHRFVHKNFVNQRLTFDTIQKPMYSNRQKNRKSTRGAVGG